MRVVSYFASVFLALFLTSALGADTAVDRANARLSRVEQIKRFHIVESPWLPGGDEVTPTMKLKRRAIDRKYAATIDALYADKE